MSTFTQWVHQHNLMLLIAAVLVLTSFVLLHHPRSRLLWSIVAGLVVSCLVAAIALRTPSASITEHRGSENELTEETGENALREISEEKRLDSVDAIEALLASGDKPTLVEVYADYGFS
jgi:thiol:disulfide interchange protein